MVLQQSLFILVFILISAACGPADGVVDPTPSAASSADPGLPVTGAQGAGAEAGSPGDRAPQLRGAQVTARTGENLGQVEDLVLDPQGVVEYTVIHTRDNRYLAAPLPVFFWEDQKDLLTSQQPGGWVRDPSPRS